MTYTPNKRKNISIDVKNEIIQLKSQGLTVNDLCEKFGFSQSTISTIIKQEKAKKVTEEIESRQFGLAKNKMRKLDFPKIDEAMKKWFEKVLNTKNATDDGPAMRRQAEKFSTMLNLNDFKASDGWLTKYKHRHNIVLKGIYSEADLPNQSEGNYSFFG